jgi:predicted RecA/RadA family phage recombinase
MGSKFVQPGEHLDYTPSSAKSAGDVVLLTGLVGICPRDIAANEASAISITGVWEVDKTTSQAWAQGEALYWVAGTSKFSTSASGNTKAGYAAKAALSADTTGQIVLKQ